MEQIVYVDVLWLIDFSMDLLSLGLAGHLMQRAVKGWRLCGAAAIGGIYAVAALFLPAAGIFGLLLDLAVAGGMVFAAFGRSSPLRFGLTLGSFFLISLLLGGSMTALCNLVASRLGRGSGDAPTGASFLLLAFGGSVITLFGARLRRRAAPRLVPLELRLGERRVVLTALSDSGNLVRDPISGRAVIFVAERSLRALCPAHLVTVLLEGRTDGLDALAPSEARRLCLIPAETVQGRMMLVALRPDEVCVSGEAVSALICAAISPMRGEYTAVVPAETVSVSSRMIDLI